MKSYNGLDLIELQVTASSSQLNINLISEAKKKVFVQLLN